MNPKTTDYQWQRREFRKTPPANGKGRRTVGIDCLPLPKNFSGAANYIFYLTATLLQAQRDFSLVVFCKPAHKFLFSSFMQPGDRIITTELRNRAEMLFFYEFRLREVLIAENILLFYATHYICPPRDERYRLIIVFHDMGFLRYPFYYPAVKRIFFGQRMKKFVERADSIIAVSESTARQIREFFPQAGQKVAAIIPGTDHMLAETSQLPNQQLVELPYMIAVNTFERRKNIPFIIQVFNCLKMQYYIPHKLLLVGHKEKGYDSVKKAIQHSPFKNEILVANSVSNAELYGYYRQSHFFINASEYEGFGFTPLEAINLGLPVFLYQNNAVAEVLGNSPTIFHHLEADIWAGKIWHEMTNGFPNKILPESIQHLTWGNTADQTIQCIEQILSSGEPIAVP